MEVSVKLLKILDLTNQIEKNSFVKNLTNIVSTLETIDTQIENIKNVSNEEINTLFKMEAVQSEFKSQIKNALAYNFDIDILIDILTRDGNCIMKRDWLNSLYRKELHEIESKVENFIKKIDVESKANVIESRKRDYAIYRECVKIAYTNDIIQNKECIITHDEFTILDTLSKCLDLSQDEKRNIYYSVIPLDKEKLDIETVIKTLKDLGIIFYSKKYLKIYIPEETIIMLRNLKGYQVASKHFRRVLKTLKDGQLWLICKQHDIDRSLNREERIKAIINKGLNIKSTLSNSIFKDDVTLSERKAILNELIDNKLQITLHSRGTTLDAKIDNLIKYFNNLEKDENLDISNEGYEKLLGDISKILPETNEIVKREFEIQEDFILLPEFLLDYNIKPRDVLDLISREDLMIFCSQLEIRTRGTIINNILQKYRDIESLYIENYHYISSRDYNTLKDNGINIKTADIGIIFENVTKSIFTKLGFDVNDKTKSKINDNKNKLDLVLKISETEIIVIECKTIKDKEYTRFSSIYRQVGAYVRLANKKGYKVLRTLIISNDFSDDFVTECDLDYDLDLTLIKAETLMNILEAFKELKLEKFPYKLLVKDTFIDDRRVIKALKR